MTEQEREEWMDELVADTEDYAYLLSQKNYEREKFNLFTRSLLQPGVSMSTMLECLSMVFDIDNAAGAQLDIIGSWVGVSRMLSYSPTTGDREMSDDELRMMIRLKIASNAWDGSNEDANRIYSRVLENADIHITQEDNQDMSVDAVVYGDVTTRQAEIIRNTNALMIPVGVGVNVSIIGGDTDFTLNVGALATGTLRIDSVTAS